MFPNWINHFQNTNLHVFESDMQKGFLQFHTSTGRNTEGHVKLYVTFSKENMESCVIRIFDYINQNNFATYSKVSDVVRSDSVVLRMVNPNAITRDNNFRANFAKYLSPREVINIANGNIESYVQSFMSNRIVKNDNFHELFMASIIATYNKYGFNHAKVALKALITKNDACHITNGNQNYRNRLLKYSHEKILKEFKDLTKDYIPNNNQDVYSYALLTILRKNYNNVSNKENISNNPSNNSSIEKLPYYLQKVIKIIAQNSDINLTNKLVQELLQGNISSLANIHDEDFDILKNYRQVDIQNAMYALVKGYSHDLNQNLINYICTLNLEPKISDKHI